MRSLILLLCFCCLVAGCDAQRKEQPQIKQETASVYPIAFYNVENLFDTENDPETDDDEFTPNGAMRYTNEIYHKKLHNIATVLQVLGDKKSKGGFALLGLAEIENDKVLNDLLEQPEIKDRGYRYVWYNSSDPRGIDVALVYNPVYFTVITSKPLHISLDGMGGKEGTRDVLYVMGRMGADTIHVLVNHWPSRREGLAETMDKRAVAAATNRRQIDNILQKQPNAKIIVMGDMNDNPTNESITQVLGASENTNGKLYDPWAAILREGRGTEIFQHHWNLFDQVIVSVGLMHGTLHYAGADIEDRDFMKLQYGKLAGYPKRSFRGTYWSNGYSDHFPVVIYLAK